MASSTPAWLKCVVPNLPDKSNLSLPDLLKEEEALKQAKLGHLQSLIQVNRGIVAKQTEIDMLREKISNPVKAKQNSEPETKYEAETEPIDAIELFPEEVWSEIFSKLTETSDLWATSNVGALFNRLLRKSRTRWMFPQVFPHLAPYLPGEEILKCRLLSKKCNLAVDSYFESHPHFRPYLLQDQDHPRKLVSPHPLKVKGLGQRYAFCNYNFGNPALSKFTMSLLPLGLTRNPFIGREVSLIIGPRIHIEEDGGEFDFDIDPDLFWTELYVFLTSFGSHIWHFNLTIFQIHLRYSEEENMLQFLLVDLYRLLPHLRKLSISGILTGVHPNCGPPLKTLLQSLPTYPPLEVLELGGSGMQFDMRHPLLDFRFLLRTYHSQLKCLHIKAPVWNQVYHLDWPSLVELQVTQLYSKGDFNGLLIMNLASLHRLGLVLEPEHTHDWSLDVLLEVINRAGPFPVLRLDAPGISMKFLAKVISNLYAPQTLKLLEIPYTVSSSPIPNLSFLTRFPFLETLSFFLDASGRAIPTVEERRDIRRYLLDVQDEDQEEEEGTEGRNIVKVDERDPYGSNLWQLLPKLKMISFQCKVYTREGYECETKKKM